jgi:phage-related protein (TIGR01555 family)
MSTRRQRRQQNAHTAPAAPIASTVPAAPATVQDANPMTLTRPGHGAAYDAAVEHGAPSRTTDAFSNPAARTGYGTANLLQATEYPLTRLTQNYQLLNSLYRGNWIVKNIIDTIPGDMLKNWIKINTQAPPEQLDQLEKHIRNIRLRSQLNLGLRWGRLYGGAGGLMLIKGHEGILDQPLDLATVLPDAFRGLYVIDRWSGLYPTGTFVDDISDPDYGMPDFYMVTDANDHTVARVHHSRVVRFEGAKLPYWESIAEMGWGASEIEAAYDEIVRRDNIAANIASLTFKALTTVREIDDLDQLFGAGNNQAQSRFWNMIQQQSVFQSNLGMQLINKGEAFNTHQFTFSGLSDVYNSVQMDVAGATGIPVTKLFGRSPAGLSSTGEGDLENYYNRIEQVQEDSLRPKLDRLLPLIAVSAWGEIPDDLDFIFNPVRSPKIEDMSKIVRFKVNAIVQTFKEGLVDQGTAQKELRELVEQTGMFSNVTDALIEDGLGKWVWQLGGGGDLPGLPTPSDPDAGDDGSDLGGEEEMPAD